MTPPQVHYFAIRAHKTQGNALLNIYQFMLKTIIKDTREQPDGEHLG